MRNQTDQYGGNLPQDLTLLDVPITELTETEINGINNLDWYCFEGNKTNHIFVSCSKLEKVLGGLIDEISPDDWDNENIELNKIDSVLHRWSEQDGFYWA